MAKGSWVFHKKEIPNKWGIVCCTTEMLSVRNIFFFNMSKQRMALKKCGTVAHLTRATVVERWLKMRRKHGWPFAMWHLVAFALLTIGRTIHNMPPGMSPLRGGVFTDYQVLTALAHHQQTVMTNETIHIRMPTLLLYCGIWNANQPAATWKVLKICTQLCGYVLHRERDGAVELIWNVASYAMKFLLFW